MVAKRADRDAVEQIPRMHSLRPDIIDDPSRIKIRHSA